jgi:hypothetical protein
LWSQRWLHSGVAVVFALQSWQAAVQGCSDGGCDTVTQPPVLLPLMKWVDGGG